MDELAVERPVSALLRCIDEELESHNRTSVNITGRAREVEADHSRSSQLRE